MTGREKMEAAFSAQGSPETPAVICYEGLMVRDHWPQITTQPWWAQLAPDVATQLEWRRDAVRKIGQDWFNVGPFCSRAERQRMALVQQGDKVFRVDKTTGATSLVPEPQIGGWTARGRSESVHPGEPPATRDEVDRLIPEPTPFDLRQFKAEGIGDLAEVLVREFGNSLLPLAHVASPLWRGYAIWGFEGLMTMVADRPDLVEYACERALNEALTSVLLCAALGAKAIWIEECLTDMIGPAAFARLNTPFVQRLVHAIREAGMKSVYYYCGNPAGKWDLILGSGADALAFEESKKGFTIDIDDVVDRVKSRCTILGNLDAINLLPRATEAQLRREIHRQIAAGRRNGGRFIMSLGSPVTPETSIQRVRLYCDLAHAIDAGA